MLMSFLQSFGSALAAKAIYFRTLEELNRLTDRELRDIGLDRSQIYEVAAGNAVGIVRGVPSIAATARTA